MAASRRSGSNYTWQLLENLAPTTPGSYSKIWFELYLADLLDDLVPTIWQLLEDLVPTIPGSYLKIWFQLYMAAT